MSKLFNTQYLNFKDTDGSDTDEDIGTENVLVRTWLEKVKNDWATMT